MSFSNTDYLMENLPARYRREDKELLLKRFLSHFGDRLDEYDTAFESFDESIDPATATASWIAFWLLVLFDWSWFPKWFSLADKRRLYGNFAQHLARRGTRRGIELWLLDFGIVARVHVRSAPWGEFIWGEVQYSITEPLHLIVEILAFQTDQQDVSIWGESFWGEFLWTAPPPQFTDREIQDLVRYQQPVAQEITLIWRTREITDPSLEDAVNWAQISW